VKARSIGGLYFWLKALLVLLGRNSWYTKWHTVPSVPLARFQGCNCSIRCRSRLVPKGHLPRMLCAILFVESDRIRVLLSGKFYSFENVDYSRRISCIRKFSLFCCTN